MTATPDILLKGASTQRPEEAKVSLGRLEVILLGLLSTGDRTGYDAWKWLEGHGPFVGYTAKTSQIYRQLGKLVEWEWATQFLDPRSSGPDAKLYRITDAGRSTLQEWIDSPYIPSPRPLDPDFQVRLRFAGSSGPEKALELVRIELAYRRKREASIDRTFDEVLVSADATAEERQWSMEWFLMQNERGHYMVSNLIAWLEAAERRLQMLIGKTSEGQE
ncbi:PadR family transcriptional regulator [Arthrobacter sp. MMS18-M83]|uniref:PadR family transcriptional regulator n=1 Tax=Arthrobacter sp. MMS18-M83 TaxID=2996261 RepID=UPI002279F46F|nr:PadR family transcriptional regulator [Arthrobacter sp. MMS18-M83]WAH97339.1 PadR family transcriptional regulator [Arthrobacter sp. MMS18-M83]